MFWHPAVSEETFGAGEGQKHARPTISDPKAETCMINDKSKNASASFKPTYEIPQEQKHARPTVSGPKAGVVSGDIHI